MKKQANELAPLGWGPSLVIFGGFSLLLILETNYLIPFLSEISGLELVLSWFIVAGLGIFSPLLVLAVLMLEKENRPWNMDLWRQRMRFKRLSAAHLRLTLLGILGIMVSSLVIIQVLTYLLGSFHSQPPFMAFEPLGPGRYWILAVWLPFWLLNIMGEEVLWRGVLLPRQEKAFGKRTWIVHGICWGIFHIGFGWKLLVTVAPILFIQSYIVQKTGNSWTGVIIHAVVNGPSFIAISLGVL